MTLSLFDDYILVNLRIFWRVLYAHLWVGNIKEKENLKTNNSLIYKHLVIMWTCRLKGKEPEADLSPSASANMTPRTRPGNCEEMRAVLFKTPAPLLFVPLCF